MTHTIPVLNAVLTHEISTWYGPFYNSLYCDEIRNIIGPINAINSTVREKKTNKGQVVFDVLYEINNWGLRKLPAPKNKRKNHLIIAGDSNTFGVGVKDEETIPFLMTNKLPDYHGYNFGIVGSGPHNTLALLEFTPWEKEIEETDGKMIYIFYPAWLISRLIGSKDYIKWANKINPWYDLDEKNNLVYRGNFDSRFATYVYKIINLVDYYGWVGNLPKINSGHIKLAAKVFFKMKIEYLKKFPKGKFIVAVSDASNITHEMVQEVITILKAEGLDVVYIPSEKINDPSFHFLDYHYNQLGQQFMADELVRSIF
jgi:hypothetical protein